MKDRSSVYYSAFNHSPVCAYCKNYIRNNSRQCKAFSNEYSIPKEIWEGKNDHSKPYPGDNGIRFALDPRFEERK
jgi:hypothetical protein